MYMCFPSCYKWSSVVISWLAEFIGRKVLGFLWTIYEWWVMTGNSTIIAWMGQYLHQSPTFHPYKLCKCLNPQTLVPFQLIQCHPQIQYLCVHIMQMQHLWGLRAVLPHSPIKLRSPDRGVFAILISLYWNWFRDVSFNNLSGQIPSTHAQVL